MSVREIIIRRRLIGKFLWFIILVCLVLFGYLFFLLYDPGHWIGEISLAAGGLFVALIAAGFVLPRYVGRKESIRRAVAAKQKELEKWGFHSRDREGPWLNYFEGPLIVKTDISPETTFFSDWVIIQDGFVIVNPGKSSVDGETNQIEYDLDRWRTYAWDGCTPKAWFFWFMMLGTPDWFNKRLETVTVWYDADKEVHYPCKRTVFWPMAHKASVVHDALYQFLDNLPITKREVDRLFQKLLVEAGMPRSVAAGYYLAVKYFGARGVEQGRLGQNSPFSSMTYTELLRGEVQECS